MRIEHGSQYERYFSFFSAGRRVSSVYHGKTYNVFNAIGKELHVNLLMPLLTA